MASSALTIQAPDIVRGAGATANAAARTSRRMEAICGSSLAARKLIQPNSSKHANAGARGIAGGKLRASAGTRREWRRGRDPTKASDSCREVSRLDREAPGKDQNGDHPHE